jgi:outer membrane protein TolC
VSYYALLNAQEKLSGALLDRTQAIADRYADSAALFQALGGGWWKEQGKPGTQSTAAKEGR